MDKRGKLSVTDIRKTTDSIREADAQEGRCCKVPRD